ncbi:unnamed protein product [Periconia digitata]|uniref:Uncharacterized protein n=1 Tax=Periconia digitata TaxID=1303443 RepID=A0A9W4UHA3_9PLEO|nr:unnamed protein product [Periconia digitata]
MIWSRGTIIFCTVAASFALCGCIALCYWKINAHKKKSSQSRCTFWSHNEQSNVGRLKEDTVDGRDVESSTITELRTHPAITEQQSIGRATEPNHHASRANSPAPDPGVAYTDVAFRVQIVPLPILPPIPAWSTNEIREDMSNSEHIELP